MQEMDAILFYMVTVVFLGLFPMPFLIIPNTEFAFWEYFGDVFIEKSIIAIVIRSPS